jgi:hypothetical protein
LTGLDDETWKNAGLKPLEWRRILAADRKSRKAAKARLNSL